MDDDRLNELAAKAYRTYADSIGNRNEKYPEIELLWPTFSELEADIQKAWKSAAAEVLTWLVDSGV